MTPPQLRLVFRRFLYSLFPAENIQMNPSLIIVPTYNERENLPRITGKLLSLTVPVDVLVVDGNSPDGTGKIADELAARHPEVHVVHEQGKNGLGRAYIAGFKWALSRKYEFIFEMDSDGQHNPDDIPELLKAAENALSSETNRTWVTLSTTTG
jgi:dolichol-phosphate mannosyltransferase